jgi:trans-feruloyl-CoA hydratase/vanillin synthase
MSEYETVQVDVTGDVGTLTFDRPEKKNAMSPRLLADTKSVLDELRGDVHVLVVTGNETFNAGMDFDKYFQEARAEGPHAVREANRIHKEALTTLKDFPQPTVAKVDGWAVGGGYMVMALCDMAIAAEDATFTLSEINFGIPAGGGTMWSVANTLNRRQTLYYTMTGEPFSGAEAAEMGAINAAVPAEELDDAVEDLAETLAEKNKLALEYSKLYYERVKNMEFDEAHDYELAKGEEMKYYQGYEFLSEGVGQFVADEYQPGAGESYDPQSPDTDD